MMYTMPFLVKWHKILYIYKQMSEEKIIHSFLKACLINLYKTEKMIAVRNQRIAEFQLHWSTFEKLFEDC